jgi:hypothetical protein
MAKPLILDGAASNVCYWHKADMSRLSSNRLGGLEVDNQFELDRGLNGKLARLLALEDAIDIDCRAPIGIELVNSIGQQAAEFSEGSARLGLDVPWFLRQRADEVIE